MCVCADLALVFHTLSEKIRCIVIMFGHTDLACALMNERRLERVVMCRL